MQQLLCPQHAKIEGLDAVTDADPMDSRDLDVAPDGGGSGGIGPGLGDGPMRFGAPLNGRSTSTNSRSCGKEGSEVRHLVRF